MHTIKNCIKKSENLQFLIFIFISFPLVFYYYFSHYRIYVAIVYILGFLVFLLNISLLIRVNRLQLYIMSSLIFMTVIIFFTFSHLVPALLSFRLFFGLFVLTLIYGFIKIPDLNKVTIFLSIWTLGEYALIRIFPDLIYVLPNYDDTFSLSQTTQIFGGAHSFGGNRTVTAVILLALFAYLEGTQPNRKQRYLPLLACILTSSGTAFALFLLYLIIKLWAKLIPFMFVILIFGIVIFFVDGDAYLISKFNYEYIKYIFNFKSDQIIHYWDEVRGFSDLFFGMGSRAFVTMSNEVENYGSSYGDFILLEFISRYGLLGALLLILPIIYTKDSARTSLYLLVLGSLHYGVIFSTPGQLIAACLMVIGVKESNTYYKLKINKSNKKFL